MNIWQINNKIIINGKELPSTPNNKYNNVIAIDDKVYIDGYELRGNKWVRTPKALLYNILY